MRLFFRRMFAGKCWQIQRFAHMDPESRAEFFFPLEIRSHRDQNRFDPIPGEFDGLAFNEGSLSGVLFS